MRLSHAVLGAVLPAGRDLRGAVAGGAGRGRRGQGRLDRLRLDGEEQRGPVLRAHPRLGRRREEEERLVLPAT